MTAAKLTGTDGAFAHAATRGGRPDEVFARAQRHSRRVRALKVGLPALAVAAVVGFVGWNYLAIPTVNGISLAGAAITDGKLVMANPRLDGFTKDKLPYSMTAARAIQDLANTSVIRLEDIDATLPVDPARSATVTAKSGVYDNDRSVLMFDSAMTVTTADGMVANLNSARLDMDAGTLSTKDAVEIRTGGSRITAQSMVMSDKGNVIVFEKRVRVDIEPRKTSGNTANGNGNAAN
jgi:lipopolysaccharide export system protein LptC